MCKRKDNRSPQPTPTPKKKLIDLFHPEQAPGYHFGSLPFQWKLPPPPFYFPKHGHDSPPPHTQTLQILDVKAPSLLARPKKTLLWQQLRCHVPMGPYGPENMAGWGELSSPSLRCPHSNPNPNPFLPFPSSLPGPRSDLTHTRDKIHQHKQSCPPPPPGGSSPPILASPPALLAGMQGRGHSSCPRWTSC